MMRGLDTELFLLFRPSHCDHDSLVVGLVFSLFNKPILVSMVSESAPRTHSFWHSFLCLCCYRSAGARLSPSVREGERHEM
jgi:hypothetical protein